MVNYSQVSYLNLTAYFDTGMLKYFYFLILLCLYVLIILSNVFLIVLICVNRSLHEPMYLFLCSLFVNELFGSTGLFPLLLFQILKHLHTVLVSLCFLQIFCVYSYGCIEFTTLAVMSYDRYLAICHPLQYHTLMTSTKVSVLITLMWCFPFLVITVAFSLSSPLHLCGNIINKVYCDNYSIVKLSCSDTTYDRYLAICHPLQYHTLMTSTKMSVLITLMWCFPFLVVAVVVLSSPLHLCGNIINKVYCNNYFIVKLSCSDTKVINIYELIIGFISMCVPVMLIVYTYMRILKVCFSGSKQTRHKAVSTCTPHLASLINFVFGCVFDIISSGLDMNHVPHTLRIFLSVHFLICQPIFNPLVYGLKMSKIRNTCNNLRSAYVQATLTRPHGPSLHIQIHLVVISASVMLLMPQLPANPEQMVILEMFGEEEVT
ncbi:olfactory receptor 2A12-like [Sphaeramia orbicularis]|uniref:olfactory receptor 2A12-like n=1 Tax=Sphaeramia orbicularis TaxID=375764 RepID=UPI00117FA89F|nr:olfactory receptor 2A12-like [Sphaeramia orbicularis]